MPFNVLEVPRSLTQLTTLIVIGVDSAGPVSVVTTDGKVMLNAALGVPEIAKTPFVAGAAPTRRDAVPARTPLRGNTTVVAATLDPIVPKYNGVPAVIVIGDKIVADAVPVPVAEDCAKVVTENPKITRASVNNLFMFFMV